MGTIFSMMVDTFLLKSSKEVLDTQLNEAIQIIESSPRKELKSLGFNEKEKKFLSATVGTDSI